MAIIERNGKRSSAGVVVTLTVLLLSAAAMHACGTDIESGINRANDLVYQKQYVEAERLYRKLLHRIEKLGDVDELTDANQVLHLHVLDRLGRLNALYLHDYPKAVADYGSLVRHYPKTDQAFAARVTTADIYQHKLADLNKAIDQLQALISEFPNRRETPKAQLQVAQAYFRLKNYEQARREAELLIDRWGSTPEASEARFQIANSYYVQGRYTEAIATYERMLDEDTEAVLAALVLFELGNCFQELKEPERALAYYYACLANHPNPLIVQRKIRRVRTRLHSAKPTAGIRLPDYFKTLASVTEPGKTAKRHGRVAAGAVVAPAIAPRTSAAGVPKAAAPGGVQPSAPRKVAPSTATASTPVVASPTTKAPAADPKIANKPKPKAAPTPAKAAPAPAASPPAKKAAPPAASKSKKAKPPSEPSAPKTAASPSEPATDSAAP